MATMTVPEEMALTVDLEVSINAPASKVFAAVLKQLGPEFGPDGHSMPLTLEARPGGRWFRDLGNDQGHLWGHVQVIKKDRILEITGPFFMSYAAINHLQFKLDADGNKTRLVFKHTAIGMIDDNHRKGVTEGWTKTMEQIRKAAEGH